MTEPLRDTVVIQGVGDMRPIVAAIDYESTLDDFLYDVAEEKDQAFTNQESPGGEVWEALAASTVKRKGFATILVDTGALRSSLVDIGGPGNVSATNSHGLIYGTDVEYAGFHEYGTKFIPARPFMGISPELIDKLADRVSDVTADQVADDQAIAVSDAFDWIHVGGSGAKG